MKHLLILIALLTSLIGYSQDTIIIEVGDPGFEVYLPDYEVGVGCLVYDCPEHSPRVRYVNEVWVDVDTVSLGDLGCRHNYLTQEIGDFTTSDTVVYNYYREAICRKCLMYVRQSNKSEFERLRQSIRK